MELIYLKNYDIKPKNKVKVSFCGNNIDILYTGHKSEGAKIVKIDKNHYACTITGELFDYQKSVTRADDYANVKRSLRYARDMINTNCTEPLNCKFITLTYKDNMTDVNKLRYDTGNFNKRLREAIGPYEYITAAEPQGRGAWHNHMLLINDHRMSYLHYNTVSAAWQQGNVYVESIDNISNVGAYLSSYLVDMPLSDYKKADYKILNPEIKEVELDGKKKKYVKGARLNMYPSGMHIFRYSSGLKRPFYTYVDYELIKDLLDGAEKIYESSVLFSDPDRDLKHIIKRESYNVSRIDFSKKESL